MKFKFFALIFAFFILLSGSILLLLVPNDLLSSQSRFFPGLTQTGGLYVNVQKGHAHIKIDGQDFGTTPQSITQLPIGQHLVELRRIGEYEKFYGKQTFVVNVIEHAEVVINVDLLPDGEFAGYIISFNEKLLDSPSKSSISITGLPEDTKVEIDDEPIGFLPVQDYALAPGEHNIHLSKEGYESDSFTVKTEPGYNLNVRTKLQAIPLEFVVVQ